MNRPLDIKYPYKHNNLEVLEFIGRKNWARMVRVACYCGKEFETYEKGIRNQHARSCGCLYRSTRFLSQERHHFSKTRIYKVWKGIKRRCLKKKDSNYHNYGGRGITIAKEWEKDFMCFYKYIGEPPFEKAEIDRINNNGNYEPGNVRWSTRLENSRNTRKTKMYLGIPFYLVCDAAKKYGITNKQIARRALNEMPWEVFKSTPHKGKEDVWCAFIKDIKHLFE